MVRLQSADYGYCPFMGPTFENCGCGNFSIYDVPTEVATLESYSAFWEINHSESCQGGACASAYVIFLYGPKPKAHGGRDPTVQVRMSIGVAGCEDCFPVHDGEPCVTELYCPNGASYTGTDQSVLGTPYGVLPGCCIDYALSDLCALMCENCACRCQSLFRSYAVCSPGPGCDEYSNDHFRYKPECIAYSPIEPTAGGFIGAG